MTQQPVASPCIKVCCVEPESRLCLGCYRTLPEIAAWQRFTDQERSDIMAALPLRSQNLPPIYKAAGERLKTTG